MDARMNNARNALNEIKNKRYSEMTKIEEVIFELQRLISCKPIQILAEKAALEYKTLHHFNECKESTNRFLLKDLEEEKMDKKQDSSALEEFFATVKNYYPGSVELTSQRVRAEKEYHQLISDHKDSFVLQFRLGQIKTQLGQLGIFQNKTDHWFYTENSVEKMAESLLDAIKKMARMEI